MDPFHPSSVVQISDLQVLPNRINGWDVTGDFELVNALETVTKPDRL